jgi:hypothetical protein
LRLNLSFPLIYEHVTIKTKCPIQVRDFQMDVTDPDIFTDWIASLHQMF